MNECICGEQALYFCRSCLVAICKKHKIVHETRRKSQHLYEKLGMKLTIQQIEKNCRQYITKNQGSK